MGLDALKNYLIKNAEKFAGENKGKVDGQLDSKEEIRLFGESVKGAKARGLISEYDANMLAKEFGLELSDSAHTGTRANTRGDSGNNGGIYITIDASVNVNIDITIGVEVKNEIQTAVECGCTGDLAAILSKLLDGSEDSRNILTQFVVLLFDIFKEQGIDFGKMQEMMEQILAQVEVNGQHIENVEEVANQTNQYVKELMGQFAEFLNMYGIDVKEIKQMIKDGDAYTQQLIGQVLAVINNLKNEMGDYDASTKALINEVLALIKIGGGGGTVDLSEVLSLLYSIKADTSDTKQNSETIIKLLKEGNENIINAIKNISVIGGSYDDTKVREMLTEILTKLTGVATKDDLDALLKKFNASLNNLQVALEKATGDAKTEILNAISAINIDITLPDGYDDSGLKNLLTQILNNMVTKEDLSNQMKKFQEMVATLETNLKNVSEQHKKEIIEAINKISVNVNIPDEYKQLLLQIINDMVTKGDLDAQLNKFKVMIDNLQVAIENASEEDKVEIINAINAINIDITMPDGYDDSGLKNLLSQILNNMVTKDDLSNQMKKFQEMVATLETNLNNVSEKHKKEIIEAINNISVNVNIPDEYKTMLLQIINNMVTKGDLDAQLEELKKLIANAQKAIEFAISTSETNIINHINKVAENININPEAPNLDGIIALLNNILAKLDDSAKANAKYYTDVMAAIANIKPGDSVDLSEVLKLLNAIKDLAEANGGKLDNVLNNQATIKLTLDGIVNGLNTLTDKTDAIKKVVDEILAIVKNLHNCECDCVDEATLRIILCEFVAQINAQPHEGVQGGDILGTRAGTRGESTFEAACHKFVEDLKSLGLHPAEGDTTGISAPKSNAKPGVYYDLNGRELGTEKPSRPGVYIVDGKKVLVK